MSIKLTIFLNPEFLVFVVDRISAGITVFLVSTPTLEGFTTFIASLCSSQRTNIPTPLSHPDLRNKKRSSSSI